jgi:hypothetical protein
MPSVPKYLRTIQNPAAQIIPAAILTRSGSRPLQKIFDILTGAAKPAFTITRRKGSDFSGLWS